MPKDNNPPQNSAPVSQNIVKQRVRNRMIEYFETASSFVHTAKFGAFETINQWEDYLDKRGSLEGGFFQPPVLDNLELEAMKKFHHVWNRTADATHIDIFDSELLSGSADWKAFKDAASTCLQIFMIRGKFSEYCEIE